MRLEASYSARIRSNHALKRSSVVAHPNLYEVTEKCLDGGGAIEAMTEKSPHAV